MVVSLCDAGPAGRMHPWDGAAPEFSTSSPGIRHEGPEDELADSELRRSGYRSPMSLSSWWARSWAEAEREMASQRVRAQRAGERPPGWVRFLDRHRWASLSATVAIVAI